MGHANAQNDALSSERLGEHCVCSLDGMRAIKTGLYFSYSGKGTRTRPSPIE